MNTEELSLGGTTTQAQQQKDIGLSHSDSMDVDETAGAWVQSGNPFADTDAEAILSNIKNGTVHVEDDDGVGKVDNMNSNRGKRKREENDDGYTDKTDAVVAKLSVETVQAANGKAKTIAAEMEDFIEEDSDADEGANNNEEAGESEFEDDDEDADESDSDIEDGDDVGDSDAPPTESETEERKPSKICDLTSQNILPIAASSRPKRERKPVERYLDPDHMKLMFADVPPEEVDDVFNDKDEYFQKRFVDNGLQEDDDDEEDEEDSEEDDEDETMAD